MPKSRWVTQDFATLKEVARFLSSLETNVAVEAKVLALDGNRAGMMSAYSVIYRSDNPLDGMKL